MKKEFFVYKYTFPNNKVYIGKTSLAGKRYGNPYEYRSQLVYRAMQKYPDFEKEILGYFETEEEAFLAEKKYIKQYEATNPKKGYNLSDGGDGNSLLFLRKPVQQFLLEGLFIKEYPSIKHASLETGILSSLITIACSDKYSSKMAGGFQWKYKQDSKKIENIKNKYIKNKKIYKLDLQGNILKEYQNLSEASLENNIPISHIRRVCNHERQTTGNFAWCYEDEVERNKFKGVSISEKNKEKRIKQYDLEGNFIREFSSATEAANEYGIDTSSISHVCRGKRKLAAGFQWRYYEDNSILHNLIKEGYERKNPNKNAKKGGEKNA